MTVVRAFACLLLFTVPVFAQDPAPRFEVASVHAATDQGGAVAAGVRITGTQVRIVSLSLQNYIAIAYRLKPSQVIAPDWVPQLRFDVSANLPDSASREQVPAMLRTLLTERFQLKAHLETRESSVYGLAVAKGGLKIKGTPIDPNESRPSAFTAGGTGSTAGVVINLGGDSTFSLADNKLSVHQLTMAQLAEGLTRFTDRTVIDNTSLPERYDFTVDLTPEDYQYVLMRSAVNAGVTLPSQALRLLDAGPSNPLGPYLEKTGLVLEPRRAPLDVIVVDSVLRSPTEN